MKKNLIICLLASLSVHQAKADSLNLVNLAGKEAIEIVLLIADAKHRMSVEPFSSSGPFKLKETSAALRTVSEDLPDLEIPKSAEKRIAVLFASGNSVEWRLISSEATLDKWSFRVVNLSGETAFFSHKKKDISIEAGKETRIPVKRWDDIGLALAGGEPQSYHHREPCAVIAFVTRSAGKTNVTFVPDI